MKKTKDNLLSKNNYDIQFEELLEQKKYTDEAKSLILNIVYKKHKVIINIITTNTIIKVLVLFFLFI